MDVPEHKSMVDNELQHKAILGFLFSSDIGVIQSVVTCRSHHVNEGGIQGPKHAWESTVMLDHFSYLHSEIIWGMSIQDAAQDVCMQSSLLLIYVYIFRGRGTGWKCVFVPMHMLNHAFVIVKSLYTYRHRNF